MVHDPLTHAATVAVEHIDLMLLGAPINAYKAIVEWGLILSFGRHDGRHDKAHSSLSSLSRVSLCDDLA
jgi:hypothetical protein